MPFLRLKSMNPAHIGSPNAWRRPVISMILATCKFQLYPAVRDDINYIRPSAMTQVSLTSMTPEARNLRYNMPWFPVCSAFLAPHLPRQLFASLKMISSTRTTYVEEPAYAHLCRENGMSCANAAWLGDVPGVGTMERT
jgi:hypothetical protein